MIQNIPEAAASASPCLAVFLVSYCGASGDVWTVVAEEPGGWSPAGGARHGWSQAWVEPGGWSQAGGARRVEPGTAQ